MNVSICNRGQLPTSVVTGAEHRAANVLISAGVEVVWRECGQGPDAVQAAHEHWYTIRLRSDAAPSGPDGTSFDVMGAAHTSAETPGYIADVYFKAVQGMADYLFRR